MSAEDNDEQLQLVLELSKKEAEDEQRKRSSKSEIETFGGSNGGSGNGYGSKPNVDSLHNIELHPESFGSHIQIAFSGLYGSTLFADVVLKVGNEKIPAHRIVLCSWSETFRAMMENTIWKESQMNELTIDLMDEKEAEIFKTMIQFMYTGYLKINIDNLTPLLSLSNYYTVIPLKESCGKILGENLSDENVFALLDICERFDCTGLRVLCAAYLADNFVELMKSAKIMELDADTWSEMLKSDDILVNAEEDIFDSVMKYCDQFVSDKEKRDRCLTKILPSVRFPLLSNQFLVERIEQNKSLQHIPLVQTLLHETFRYKAYPSCKPRQSIKPRKSFCSFDIEGSPNTIKISADGKTATYIGGTALGWVTTNVLPSFAQESRYMEFKINTAGSGGVFVGVGSVVQNGINVGSTTTSWGYMSTGQLYVNGSVATHYVGFTSGDRIGVFYEVVKGNRKLQFYKNGVSLGDVASFNNISTSGTTLYPQVTYYTSNDSMSITSVSSPELFEKTKGL